ncbi:MAG: hypothetical protein HY290_26005 [Planctomycetia bacterium]|nr:hypothetical protein [Planctomycetia bacterium]
MGHSRYGYMPDTAPWREVIALIADGSAVAKIADATLDAAQRGLKLAYDDPGLGYAAYLLSKVVLAARESNFQAALSTAGISVSANPGLLDVVGGFSQAMDQHLRRTGARTDIGEMAQLAAVESLTSLVGERSTSLFGTTAAEVKSGVRELSTMNGFGTLAHDFFARVTERFLTYHLSRELSCHVGPNERFKSVSEHTGFLGELRNHCRQAALIVQKFAAGWYSKAKFEDGISQRKAQNFANYALKKLRDEMRVRRERGVD